MLSTTQSFTDSENRKYASLDAQIQAKKSSEKKAKCFYCKKTDKVTEIYYKHRLILRLTDKACAIKYAADQNLTLKNLIDHLLNTYIKRCAIFKKRACLEVHDEYGIEYINTTKLNIIRKIGSTLNEIEREELTRELDINRVIKMLKHLKVVNQRLGYGHCEAVKLVNGTLIYYRNRKVAWITHTGTELILDTGSKITQYKEKKWNPFSYDFQCVVTHLVRHAGYKARWSKHGWLQLVDKNSPKVKLFVPGESLFLEKKAKPITF